MYLKLQPYVQTSLAPRAHQKLAYRFFGPYRILARIGSVAYKLDLPPHTSIHPVFHVSQLKQAVGSGHQVKPTLPSDFALKLTPEQVLHTRTVRRGDTAVTQVLIKWNNLPSSLSTWEDYEALRQEFPRAAVWGQPASQGRGVSASSVLLKRNRLLLPIRQQQRTRPEAKRAGREPSSQVSGTRLMSGSARTSQSVQRLCA